MGGRDSFVPQSSTRAQALFYPELRERGISVATKRAEKLVRKRTRTRQK